MQYIVYVDVLFGINYILDLYILLLTGKLCRKHLRWWRICIGGLAGSVLSLGYTYMNLFICRRLVAPYSHSILSGLCLGVWNVLGLFIIGLSMEVIAFPIFGLRDALQIFGIQLLVAFGLAGIVAACRQLPFFRSLLFDEASRNSLNIPTFFGIMLSGAVVLFLLEEGRYRYQKTHGLLCYTGVLWFENNQKKSYGFVDTGNMLVEPISRKPVVVADGSFIMSILPEDYQRLVRIYMEEGIIDYEWIAKKGLNYAKWIPYCTVGEADGNMLGIQCTRLILYQDNTYKNIHPVIVGISHTGVDVNQKYQLILPQAFV